jgi:hypothetical protein
MAGNSSGRVGYKRVIIISVLATAFAVAADYYGLIDAIAKRI